MNVWMVASQIVMLAMCPLAWLAMRGDARSRLPALYMGSAVGTLLLMLLTMAFHRMPMIDLALTLSLMSFGGGIVFARFFARHLK